MAEREVIVADARTGKRFPVQLPIRIQVSEKDDGQDGMTANVSAAGVYIRAEAARRAGGGEGQRIFRPGASIEFDMTLPADVIGAEDDVHIHCRGRVVRVERLAEEEERRHGVACVIDKYEFVRKS